jgi:SAM-dependent methyltransferase
MLAQLNNKQIATSRWAKAQEYEQGYWQRLGNDIEAGARERLDWYGWRAGQLEARLTPVLGPPPRLGRVLEIGSGPIGIVNFLDWGERFAVDPLENFYCTRAPLVGLRKPGVTYLAGTGEELAFEDASFSLVIIDNVLDHTYHPTQILREIWRILRPDGCLYLSVNVHTAWGAILHTALAVLQIDKGHPYTYTSRTLRELVRAHRFAILAEQIHDYTQAREDDRRSERRTDRIKGYTGLSEFSHSMLCRKQHFSS